MTTTSYTTNPLSTPSSQNGGRGKRSRKMVRGSMRASRAASRSMALAGGRRRKRRGGYTSATTYNEYVNGSGDSQFARTFENGYPTPFGNESTGLQAQNTVIPPSVASSGVITGGKKRSKKGGYWSQILSTALVPFGLLAAQNRFSKRIGLRHHGKTRKNHK